MVDDTVSPDVCSTSNPLSARAEDSAATTQQPTNPEADGNDLREFPASHENVEETPTPGQKVEHSISSMYDVFSCKKSLGSRGRESFLWAANPVLRRSSGRSPAEPVKLSERAALAEQLATEESEAAALFQVLNGQGILNSSSN